MDEFSQLPPPEMKSFPVRKSQGWATEMVSHIPEERLTRFPYLGMLHLLEKVSHSLERKHNISDGVHKKLHDTHPVWAAMG